MSAFSQPAALALLALCFCYIALKFVHHQLHSQNDLKYPPGPPSPSFLFGHFGRMPMKKPWLYYQELGRVYGMGVRSIVSIHKFDISAIKVI